MRSEEGLETLDGISSRLLHRLMTGKKRIKIIKDEDEDETYCD